MDVLLNWIWQGGAVALAVAAVLRVARPVPARVRYRIWWAALLTVAVLPLVAPAVPSAAIGAQVGDARGSEALLPVIAVPAAAQAAGALPAGVWLAWIAWWGGHLLAAVARTRRLRAASVPVASSVEGRLRRWSGLSRRGRRAPLVISQGVASAAVLGAGRPLIAVSPSLFERLSAEDVDLIVVHERAHVQRRDDLALLFQQVVFVAIGWHPAVWWIGRRIDLEREIACDEMAARAADSPKRYATCLVRLASLRAPAAPEVTPAAISRTGLGTRVGRLLDHRPAAPWRTAFATAACSAILAGAPLLAASVTVFAVVEPAGLAAAADSDPGTSAARRAPAPAVRAAASGREPRQRTGSERAPVRRAAMSESASPAPVEAPQHVLPARPALQGTLPQARPVSARPPQVLADADYGVPVAGQLEALPGLIVAAGSAAPAATGTSGGTPWGLAAGAGETIGRGSKKAAVATAGAFSRFGKRIAGSF